MGRRQIPVAHDLIQLLARKTVPIAVGRREPHEQTIRAVLWCGRGQMALVPRQNRAAIVPAKAGQHKRSAIDLFDLFECQTAAQPVIGGPSLTVDADRSDVGPRFHVPPGNIQIFAIAECNTCAGADKSLADVNEPRCHLIVAIPSAQIGLACRPDDPVDALTGDDLRLVGGPASDKAGNYGNTGDGNNPCHFFCQYPPYAASNSSLASALIRLVDTRRR